jgi:SAM-dependent methyltransferase
MISRIAAPEMPSAPDRLSSKAAPAQGPAVLQLRNEANRLHQATVAAAREKWIQRNNYYYELLTRLLKHVIEPGKRVLNIHCQTGFLLNALKPGYGVGVDISAEMIELARNAHPEFKYYQSFSEDFLSEEKFDYILLCDVGSTVDVQKSLLQLQAACERHTRLVIYGYNFLWEPLLALAQQLRLKIPQTDQNWLSDQDLGGLLQLTGFEWLKTYRTGLLPKYVPVVSAVLNQFVAKLPVIQRLCMIEVLVARPISKPVDMDKVGVSVIVPCKDERANIESAVIRTPELGGTTEIIFCDDQSTDGTAEEVHRMQCLYPDRKIRIINGPGICKAKNVWTGFEAATGDILVILDGDLTVMPEELPYFIDAIADGRAELVNGSRLVYPVPRAAMKRFNFVGNKVFSVLFSYVLGQRIKDTLCGTKVLWRSDWERIRPMIGTWGATDYWGDYELLFGAAKLNLRIMDLPVHYQERIHGVTKMTRVFTNGLVMLRMWFCGLHKLRLTF